MPLELNERVIDICKHKGKRNEETYVRQIFTMHTTTDRVTMSGQRKRYTKVWKERKREREKERKKERKKERYRLKIRE